MILKFILWIIYNLLQKKEENRLLNYRTLELVI